MSYCAGDTAWLGPESRLRPGGPRAGVQASVCGPRVGTRGPILPCLAPEGRTGGELTESARQGAASGQASRGRALPTSDLQPAVLQADAALPSAWGGHRVCVCGNSGREPG